MKKRVFKVELNVYPKNESPEGKPGTPLRSEKKYEDMSYVELVHAAQKVPYGKEIRIINKVMKEQYGQQFPLCYRYPDLPIVISLVAITIFALSLIVEILRLCW